MTSEKGMGPVKTLVACQACRGFGTVRRTYDEYGMADPKDVTCYRCGGSGVVIQKAAKGAA